MSLLEAVITAKISGSGGGGSVTPASIVTATGQMTNQQATDTLENIGGEPEWTKSKKMAFIKAFANLAWDNANGATYYNAIVASLLNISSVAAVYTQSGTVYDNVDLDSLKGNLIVTATYDDGSSDTLDSDLYTLSGTLAAGTSTITVTFGNKTATFDVTVTSVVLFSLTNRAFNLEAIDTGVAILSDDRDFSIAMDMTITSTPASGTGSAPRPLTLITADASGMALQIAKSGSANTMYGTWQKTNGNTNLCAYGDGRIRYVVTHKAGSNSVYFKTRYASNNPVELTITEPFTTSTKNVKFGNGSSNQTLPVGTIAKAQILAYAMSEAEVNQWCGQ
jgi:hypothetical protein